MDYLLQRRRDLAQWLRFIRADSHILVERPDLLFQQAANQPEHTSPAKSAELRSQAGLESRPWIRWVNKRKAKSNSLLTLEDNYECTLCGFSPDAGHIYANSFNALNIWNASTGEPVSQIDLHRDGITACSFSPDGKLFLTASLDGSIKLGDTQSWQEIASLIGHKTFIYDSCFSPDGQMIVSVGGHPEIWPHSSSSELKVWNAKTRKIMINSVGAHHPIERCAFSEDGTIMVTSSENIITLWKPHTWEVIHSFSVPAGVIIGHAFLADRSRPFTIVYDSGAIRFWDDCAKKEAFAIDVHSDQVPVFAISPDGARFAFSSRSSVIRLWDTSTATELLALYGHGDLISALAFSPDGTLLLSASDDNCLKLWDATGTRTDSFGSRAFRACAFAPSGKRFAAAYSDGYLALVAFPEGDVLWTVSDDPRSIGACSFSPDGIHLALGLDDGEVIVRRAFQGEDPQAFQAHEKAILDVAYSPDGAVIATTSADATLKLSEPRTFTELLRIPISTETRQFRFSPDGSLIVTDEATERHVHREGKVAYYDEHNPRFSNVRTLESCVSYDGHRAKIADWAFSPDQKTLMTASHDETIMFWVVESCVKSYTLKFHPSPVVACDYSPDGTRMVSADETGLIALWDSSTLEATRILRGHRTAIVALSFSAEGSRLLTSDRYGRINIWLLGQIDRALRYESGSACVFALWNPDGAHVLAGYEDGSFRCLRLENIETGAPVVTAYYHRGSDEYFYICPQCQHSSRIKWGTANSIVRCPQCLREASLNSFYLETANDGQIHRWDSSKYEVRCVFKEKQGEPYSHVVTRIAAGIHREYVEEGLRTGADLQMPIDGRRPFLELRVPWHELRVADRHRFELEAREMMGDVFAAGRLIKVLPVDATLDLTEVVERDVEVLEALARLRHERWKKNALRDGWSWGADRDKDLKRHPCLVVWESLPEEYKDQDRAGVRKIPRILWRSGYYPAKI